MQGFPGMQGMPQGMGQGMPQGMGQGLENMDDASLLAMLQQLQGADQSTMPTELKVCWQGWREACTQLVQMLCVCAALLMTCCATWSCAGLAEKHAPGQWAGS